jgi:membrane-associated HD superfamily phosphohydrolase
MFQDSLKLVLKVLLLSLLRHKERTRNTNNWFKTLSILIILFITFCSIWRNVILNTCTSKIPYIHFVKPLVLLFAILLLETLLALLSFLYVMYIALYLFLHDSHYWLKQWIATTIFVCSFKHVFTSSKIW